MAASVQEESDDLSTCCVCLESYDKILRKPKFLPCAHTNCLQCIKDMAKAPAMQLTCPVCRKVSELPADVESLPTNLDKMHIIQLNKNKEEENLQRFWCETCEFLAKAVCHQGNHTITNLVAAKSTKVKSQLLEVSNQLSKAVANREESQGHLTEDRDWLRSKLQAIESKMEENSDCLLKLRETMEKCEDIQQLSDANKAMVSIKLKLDKMLNEARDRLKEAQKFLGLVVYGKLQKNKVASDVSKNNCDTTATAALNHGFFASNCFAANRQQLDPSLKFHCRELTGYEGGVIVVEFSADGTLLASGGFDKIVRLWPIGKSNEGVITPIEMETEHESFVYCLAVTPDNQRVLSGEMSGKVFIHDVTTYKRTNTIENLKCTRSISIKPGSDGKVFAVACEDTVLRIFDTRCSTIQPVRQTTVQQQSVKLYSTMFSPAEPNLITAAGVGGTRLFDLRKDAPISIRHSFPATGTTASVMFDSKGTRLLCREVKSQGHQVVIYKVPSDDQRQGPVEVEKTELQSPGYSVPREGLNTCCFAGDDDELVVAPSAVNHSLHVWSVLDGPNGNRSIDHSLLSLIGHKQALNTVRFCKATSLLASCGTEKVIKLWTPIYN